MRRAPLEKKPKLKKPTAAPATSHSPITTRLKIANATMATAGYAAIGMTRRNAAFSEFPRRQPAHTAPASAQAVTGHASYRVRHARANTQPVIASALNVLVARDSSPVVGAFAARGFSPAVRAAGVRV